uniref:Hypotheticial protein n=1 Tax=Schistosoma japonicum TaxID=6182 RepID=C1LKB5_SCHJA|nr:hypotheticial protein [Schistosoma japonicum]
MPNNINMLLLTGFAISGVLLTSVCNDKYRKRFHHVFGSMILVQVIIQSVGIHIKVVCIFALMLLKLVKKFAQKNIIFALRIIKINTNSGIVKSISMHLLKCKD